ncbi:hypothetical protein COY95_01885 [Candidatus Woesearchaeota archaeon CG_4_10_14_0_8_um_filter_47_5]|nr:MAG: hypothetical protein COY95_01885 [Candidatus Woesearchaeota archaeon CG_4_10_14_0_8_um_filter_47_5]
MAEREKFIDEMKLNYEGVFNLKELLALIKKFFLDKGYEYKETKKNVVVREHGKEISIEYEPWKDVDETAWVQVVLRVYMKNVIDIEVERDGIMVGVNQGKITMVFDAWVVTEMESRWENKPVLYAMKHLINKWVSVGYLKTFDGIVVGDTTKLYKLVKAYLNLQHYR